MSPIFENLTVLFLLVPVMVGAWWFLIRLVNRSMGFDLKVVYEKIYANPIASAILRVGIIYSIASLVSAAFGRYV